MRNLLASFVGFLLALTLIYANFQVRAQEAPTPVDQHWRVYYGEIETLETKLQELNRDNIKVTSGDIVISTDGKRFVIYRSDCEDCEEE